MSKPENINLFVKVYSGTKNLPTKPAGSNTGFLVPFSSRDKTLWYHPLTPLNVVLSYAEAFLWWPKKTLLHAGGAVKNQKAYVFTGIGNVGKTSIVLNLLREGFEYLSDDWLVIDSKRAYPLPKTLHVFDYNLKDKKTAKAVLGVKAPIFKIIFKILNFIREYAPHRYIRYAIEAAKPVFKVKITSIQKDAKIAKPSVIQAVYFLERKDVESIQIHRDLEAEDLARRMAYVSFYEWNFFKMEYSKYVARYGIHNSAVEKKFHHDYSIMKELFSNVPIFRVTVPKGLDLKQADITEILSND